MRGFLPRSAQFGGQQFQLPGQIAGQMPMTPAGTPDQLIANALLGRFESEPSGFGNTSTPESHLRAVDDVRRGFTNEGLGMVDALGNAMSVMGGMKAVTTGAATLAERLGDLEQGTLGGFKDIRGYSEYDQRVIDAVKSGQIKDKAGMNTMQHELDTARRGASMSDSASGGHMGGNYGGAGSRRGASSRGQRGE